ncbi:MAG: hypothetical protein FWG64_13070 [Firmicutes bacterium]|nr:hypothetical protein [Bacillota bacterium]
MIDLANLISQFEPLDGLHFVENSRTGERSRCFIAPRGNDSPDGLTNLTQPIHQTIEIYTFNETDIQNGDFLTATKETQHGTVFAEYRGICGESTKFKPFQVATLKVQAL